MTSSRKQMVFVHLLNDFSGSPLVLSEVIRSLPDEDYEKILYTADSPHPGFLSGLDGVETRHFWYRWKANPWLRLLTFSLSQGMLFFQLLRFWKKDVIIYVNTLLPFGAGLAGWLMGKKVIYHLHETSMRPPALKAFLRAIANRSAHSVIYVSYFLAAAEKLSKPFPRIIHNSLPPAFKERADRERQLLARVGHRVLMLCSPKEYKGIGEFLILAGMCPAIPFELVLNGSPAEVCAWTAQQRIPANLSVHPAQSDTHPFYKRATIVVNLSHPDKWVETFGMTILEAMCYGLPVIVPPEGGPRELVDHGVNGFRADYRDLVKIAGYIDRLVKEPALYRDFSGQALTRSRMFSADAFREAIQAAVEEFPMTFKTAL